MWWYLKWYPDESAGFHRLSNTDLLVAGVLIAIFASLCLLLLLINWAQGEITKEDEAQMLQYFMRSIQANVLPNPSLPESDEESSGSEEEQKPQLRSIPEAPPDVEEPEESLLSNSCSQVMLRRASSFGKGKKGSRSSSAPTRKKSKSTG